MFRYVLSTGASVLCLMIPMDAQTQKPAFEAVSIRPVAPRPAGATPTPPSRLPLTAGGRFYRSGESVSRLIYFAYGLTSFQLSGGPDWVRREYFTIEAATGGEHDAEQMRPMVQSLLEDRFKLVVRRERREMRHSVLRMARADGRPGRQFERCDEGPVESRPIPVPRDGVPFGVACAPMSEVARQISGHLQQLTLDGTGLEGRWRFGIVYSSGDGTGPTPPLPTVLREDLGLRLEQRDGPVDVIVIESVERPSEN
jgi:uncharacterized protein (TIGR03435 family)